MKRILTDMCTYMCGYMCAGTRVGMRLGIHAHIRAGPFGKSLNKSGAIAALEREHGISLSDMKPGV